MSFLGSMELDPEYMALYVAAAILSTIGLVILFRESRARKKALEEEKAAFEAEKEREKQEREKRAKILERFKLARSVRQPEYMI